MNLYFLVIYFPGITSRLSSAGRGEGEWGLNQKPYVGGLWIFLGIIGSQASMVHRAKIFIGLTLRLLTDL